jgi:hypothetical protein
MLNRIVSVIQMKSVMTDEAGTVSESAMEIILGNSEKIVHMDKMIGLSCYENM